MSDKLVFYCQQCNKIIAVFSSMRAIMDSIEDIIDLQERGFKQEVIFNNVYPGMFCKCPNWRNDADD